MAKTQSTKSKNNADSNELRHLANKGQVSKLGLEAEDSVRTVTRTTKHGTKVNVSTVTVTKAKRPSQLLRKEKRRKARFELELTPAA